MILRREKSEQKINCVGKKSQFRSVYEWYLDQVRLMRQLSNFSSSNEMVETSSPTSSVDPTFVDLLRSTRLSDPTGGSSEATPMSIDGRVQGESFLSSLDRVAFGGGGGVGQREVVQGGNGRVAQLSPQFRSSFCRKRYDGEVLWQCGAKWGEMVCDGSRTV